MVSAFWTLITCLPQLLTLLSKIQAQVEAANKEASIQVTVKDHIGKIHEAFDKQDPSVLNNLWNTPTV